MAFANRLFRGNKHQLRVTSRNEKSRVSPAQLGKKVGKKGSELFCKNENSFAPFLPPAIVGELGARPNLDRSHPAV
jgi:hypothetical protein